ncbi:hypothetical protein NFHSH190041_37120 (plasmid) [Shewanella sp. NFH-SH190041]|uniref:hypothetical protein n=1 Tax=Shewanella sp. NFH-SH190041 TaxID=2950245 RepID=UPI0021C3493B|nr:hypothetical protein [Shewanella sp. NFH-SH190041]BDM66260.1 hypothetical protein NFHSH190041_37120 [Shewanella sp. NFH-SH190041]
MNITSMEHKEAYDRIIKILTDGSEDAEKVSALKLIADELGVDLSRDSIDNELGLTILYGDGLDGIVSCEEDLRSDIDLIAEETSLPKKYVNDAIFDDCSDSVEHFDSGFYAGGVTVYNYPQLLRSLKEESCESFETSSS